MEDWRPASDDDEISPAEKVFLIAHIFEKILDNLIGFDKLNLIKAFPQQKYIYKKTIAELSTHNENEDLFF